KWYTCGPTVYDHAHLGHARTYVQFDILIRILTNYFGYQIGTAARYDALGSQSASSRLDHVMGLTNIDDKIITRAQELNVPPEKLALRFENDFFEDLKLCDAPNTAGFF